MVAVRKYWVDTPKGASGRLCLYIGAASPHPCRRLASYSSCLGSALAVPAGALAARAPGRRAMHFAPLGAAVETMSFIHTLLHCGGGAVGGWLRAALVRRSGYLLG